MKFCIVDASTSIDDPAAVGIIVQACDLQILNDAGDVWGRYGNVDRAGDVNQVPAGSVPIVLYDDPDQADALGWHTEALGAVFGRVFVRPVLAAGGDFYKNPALSLSSVVSHEILETLIDPTCADWSQRGDGVLIAAEVCDPVEGDSYGIPLDSLGVVCMVSNFVTPKWFDAQTTIGPFDHMGKLSAPFTMTPGGYWVEMQPGETSQVGARRPGRALARSGARSAARVNAKFRHR